MSVLDMSFLDLLEKMGVGSVRTRTREAESGGRDDP